MSVVGQAQELPRPAEIEPDIRFWTRVYTEVDTKSGFVHDSRDLNLVYQTLRFGQGDSSRTRSRKMRAGIQETKETLETLAGGKRENLTSEERRVLALWPDDVSNGELRASAGRLRFQLGQSDRFRAGLIRSGRWKPYIAQVLRENGVPAELVALPHVESSFDPTAYSKVGAAGMWQFTRSTGLRYMRIDHIVDDRRDPFFATSAAARLLKDNYDVLDNWALAITAYNHGQAGMRNAVRRVGTDRIEVILREYDGRAFGFASRNFYVAFLAAADVDARAVEYFGELAPEPEAQTILVEVPDFLTVSTLQTAFDISHRDLRTWNPALTEAVWSGDKFVPKGFELRLPESLVQNPSRLLASVDDAQRYTAQKPDIFHRVQRGDTVSGIADRYRVSATSLVQLNNLRSRNFIRVGQVLRLPGNDGTIPVTLAALNGEGGSGTYVVRSGDSVDRIARMFGLNPDALLAQNSIENGNLIYVGQELKLGTTEQPVPRPIVASLPPPGPPTAEEPRVALAAVAVEPEPAQARISSAAEEQRLLAAEAAMAVIMDSGVVESEAALAEAIDETLETNVLASEQAEMAADPSDYFVREDQTIEVQALETLGHYGDWLEIRTQRVRDLNSLPFGQAVVIGHRLKLDFSQVDPAVFEERRVAYQRQTQEAFFLAYQITDTQDHVVRSGESLWVLALRRYQVPVWLVRQYNPDLNLDRVLPGTVVKFPELRPIADTDNGTRASN